MWLLASRRLPSGTFSKSRAPAEERRALDSRDHDKDYNRKGGLTAKLLEVQEKPCGNRLVLWSSSPGVTWATTYRNS